MASAWQPLGVFCSHAAFGVRMMRTRIGRNTCSLIHYLISKRINVGYRDAYSKTESLSWNQSKRKQVENNIRWSDISTQNASINPCQRWAGEVTLRIPSSKSKEGNMDIIANSQCPKHQIQTSRTMTTFPGAETWENLSPVKGNL